MSEKMQSGREMDAEVAWVVFGLRNPDLSCNPYEASSHWYGEWERCALSSWWDKHGTFVMQREWSTNIADAWRIVEELSQRGLFFQIDSWQPSHRPNLYSAIVTNKRCTLAEEWGESAPLAICRAALNALTSGGAVPPENLASGAR